MKERRKRPAIERFTEKYEIDHISGCWNWIGGLNNFGYGGFRVGRKVLKAHRFAFEYYIAELEEGKVIAHNCNNTKCVNPKHLRQDTQSSNLTDMSYINTNPSQILTPEEVADIKNRLENNYYGLGSQLAREYNVSNSTISAIKKGVSWSHLKIS